MKTIKNFWSKLDVFQKIIAFLLFSVILLTSILAINIYCSIQKANSFEKRKERMKKEMRWERHEDFLYPKNHLDFPVYLDSNEKKQVDSIQNIYFDGFPTQKYIT